MKSAPFLPTGTSVVSQVVRPSRYGQHFFTLYVPHLSTDEGWGMQRQEVRRSSVQSVTKHPWHSRLHQWVARQVVRVGLRHGQPTPVPTIHRSDAVSRTTLLALSSLEELGNLSRYAVEKFIKTLEVGQTMSLGEQASAYSSQAWAEAIHQLSGEYQEAVLAILDETGRQSIFALHRGQPASPLVAEGRYRIECLSEHYLHGCQRICQERN